MRYRSIILAGVLLLLGTTAAQAQIEKRGQAGMAFLRNPVSAEAVGRGGVGVTMMRNAASLFWNPAGIGWVRERADLSMHYSMLQADIQQLSGAAAINVGSWGVLGASITSMDYGTLYRTHRADNEAGYVETGTFAPVAMAFGLAYARAMSDRFTFGVHLKLVHQDLGDAWIQGEEGASEPTLKSYAQTVPAVDVGATYDFQSYGITFGAAVQNVSQEVRYEAEEFSLPFAVRFSMTVDPLAFVDLGAMHDVRMGAEAYRGRDFGGKVHYGAEYHFMQAFIVRAGYMGGYDEHGLTLGAGLRQYGLRVDYAFQDVGVLGAVHLLSLGYTLDK